MEQSSQRQRLSHVPKLLPNEPVEVRSVEEGFRGSWHRGTVIECKTQIRVVKYDHLLCDDNSKNLVQFIPVIFTVDGIIPANWQPSNFPNYRGKIRPVPPRVFHNKTHLHYGQCVDVFHADAWWEGVIFDHDDGLDERVVFFPDLDDELRVPFENLRVTQDWDAASDEWKLRGNWIFLEIVEMLKAEFPVFVSLKQIWYEVRMTTCFVKEMKEWTCPLKENWKETIKEVMSDNFKVTMADLFNKLKFPDDLDMNNDFFSSMKSIDSIQDTNMDIKSDYEDLLNSKLTKTVDHSDVKQASKGMSFDSSDASINLETQELRVVESEYCPQAVIDYYSLISESNFDLLKRNNTNVKELQISAIKHLLAVGWSNFYLNDTSGKKLLVYSSPDGEKFYGLREACNYYIRQSSCFESKKEVVKEDESRTNHGKRSSKRVRKEVSPKYRIPQTILYWLIDNNFVLPRAKVEYRCKEDGSIMKEGRVSRDGIKCNCCKRTFSLSKWQKHARSINGRPSGNIFLEDGRSLLDCQLQLKVDKNSRLKENAHEIGNDGDYICSVCQYGGELVLCDQCPSAFHTSCVELKEVPDGEWFCPSCCCRICNENRFSESYEQNMDSHILDCDQCERRYHVGCLGRSEDFLKMENFLEENWFCSLKCKEIFTGLHRLLGKSIPIGRDNLTWTLLKNKAFGCSNNEAVSDMEELIENYSKLNVAVSVMHECFEAVKDIITGRDIVEDVVFCRWSELRRLNFKGFYTVLLEKDDALISAAVVRVYGEKVAEVPLVGTRFQYRRRGMCHILMHELEKNLRELGVERLVLPAVPSILQTWTRSFGFSVMNESQKFKLLGSMFLNFQGTTMCHKLLVTNLPSTEPNISEGNSCNNITNLDRISAVSKVSQASNPGEDENNVDTSFLKCYQRRKFMPVSVEACYQKYRRVKNV